MSVAIALGETLSAAALVAGAALYGALGTRRPWTGSAAAAGRPGGVGRGQRRARPAGLAGAAGGPEQRRTGALPTRGRPPRLGTGRRGGPARWADRAAVLPLAAHGHPPGRVGIGSVIGPRWHGGGASLAAEAAQSMAVVGPTQSGKTTGLAVPAILAWEGPVLAASVKTDLVRDTRRWRERCGHVWCFDPARTTGLPAARWSPLGGARTWPGARRVAADLTEVTRAEGTSADGEFWYATAAKLLAPLLFAAATSGASMADVVRWVDTQEVEEVVAILEAAGVPEALQAARASWQREERQRSAVYTTAETVLEPFAAGSVLVLADPGAAPGGTDPATPPLGTPAVGPAADIDPDVLLAGAHTLYVCAPAHDQRRLRGLFVALVKEVLDTAFARAARRGAPLDPPLLVVLDEAANLAPLAELDGLAATCAGHGIQLVTVWQDLAQVRARYGERAGTVINNHRAKLFLSGTADPLTLDQASHLVGEEELVASSVTTSRQGERTVTTSPLHRPLLPPDALRRMAPGTGVLVYGSLPPVRVALRPWFEDPVLAARGGAAPGPRGRRGRRVRRVRRVAAVVRRVARGRAPAGATRARRGRR